MNTPTRTIRPGRIRRSLFALTAAAVFLLGCGGDDDSAEGPAADGDVSAPESTDSDGTHDGAVTGESDEPSPTTTGDETADPGSVATERRDPVQVGTPSDFGDGLVVTVTEIEPVEIGGGGPGTTAGPGVVVHVDVENSTGETVSLSPLTIVANSTTGDVARPADLEGATALRGDLPPGDTASGAYAFRYDGDVEELEVDVIHAEHADVIVVLA